MTALLLLVLAAHPNPYLSQAKVFFQGGDYRQCLKRSAQAQQWESSVAEQAETAVYSGLCHFQLRQTKEAESDFALAFQIDPHVQLPSLTSPKVVSLFESLRPKDEAPQPEATAPSPPTPKVEPPRGEPPTPAPESAVDVHAEESPRAHASRRVPVVPIVFGSIAVVGTGAGLFFGAIAQSYDKQARAADFQSEAAVFRKNANSASVLANGLFVVAAACAIAALIVFLVTPSS